MFVHRRKLFVQASANDVHCSTVEQKRIVQRVHDKTKIEKASLKFGTCMSNKGAMGDKGIFNSVLTWALRQYGKLLKTLSNEDCS